MDRAVGRLMATLDEIGAADNTIVFFTSDNGPETLNRYKGSNRSYGSAGPLRARKLWLYEGGIRVPGILRWPGKAPRGRDSDEPIWSCDLLPTLCRMAGAKVPADRTIDGADFRPALEGKKIERKTPLFWHYYRALGEPRVALRDGDWVVLAHAEPLPKGAGGALKAGDMEMIKAAKLTAFELYHLKDDLHQDRDLAKEHPERLRAMSEQLRTMYREVLAEGPAWVVPEAKKAK
jgi:arylsulfatase A